MKIEVNIEKKYVFLIVGILILIAGGIFVYAYTFSLGTVPNPGHSLSSIQGYFSGDTNLQTTLGKFCQTDGTNCLASGGGSSWSIISAGSDSIASAIGSPCVTTRACAVWWGTGTCSGSFSCPTGSTKQKIGEVICTNTQVGGTGPIPIGASYICVLIS
ncbi:MAG: hypothetical protein AABW79_04030 [Nanoarchaeota archaeon]